MGSGELLDFVEVTTGAEPEYAVIWLHGLGADGRDFEPVVPYLGLPPGLAVRFIFPHATARPVTINGGMIMRAWYDIVQISLARDQDEAGIMRSAGQVRALIANEVARGIPASNIVMAGFSQGGAMALHVGLRYEQKLAGIMALSAYLLFPGRLAEERSKANAETPVFVGHGTMDPTVPLALGEATVSALEQGKWPVEWHSYPIPHSVSQPEIEDIGRWLTARLGQAR
ncbi:MAG: dienelactone hydrolase family protein [Lysobacterales bacterium]|jgi:phospholipase/carboxylesterase